MTEKAKVLLHAIERVTATPDQIKVTVEGLGARTPENHDALVRAIVAHYSNQAALIGAATALPAMLPGVGTVSMLVAGPLIDLVALMKLEVEMCCALAYAHGYDIAEPRERQLALLLAAVTTADRPGRTCLSDGLEVLGDSIWNYAPRRASKLILTALSVIAAGSIARRFLLAVPLLGAGIGAGANKLLTMRVGKRANEELRLRHKLEAPAYR